MPGYECYCLYCETGHESAVETALQEAGYRVISLVGMQGVFRRGKLVREPRALLPGYVFFQSAEEPAEKTIREIPHVYKLLRYADGKSPLRGRDLDFVQLLLSHGLGISTAVQEGAHIRILDGPLKLYEGDIIRLNRRKQNAEVRIAREGFIHTIWLGYEVIAKTER